MSQTNRTQGSIVKRVDFIMGEYSLSAPYRDRHALPPSVRARNADLVAARSDSSLVGESQARSPPLQVPSRVSVDHRILGYTTPPQRGTSRSILEESDTAMNIFMEVEIAPDEDDTSLQQVREPKRRKSLFRHKWFGDDTNTVSDTDRDDERRQKRQNSRSLSSTIMGAGRVFKRRVSALGSWGRKDSAGFVNIGDGRASVVDTDWYHSQGLVAPSWYPEETDRQSSHMMIDGTLYHVHQRDGLPEDMAEEILRSMQPLSRTSAVVQRTPSLKEPAASPVSGAFESRMNSIAKRLLEAEVRDEFDEQAISQRFSQRPLPDPFIQKEAAKSWREACETERQNHEQGFERMLAAGNSARASRSENILATTHEDAYISTSSRSSPSEETLTDNEPRRPKSFLEEQTPTLEESGVPY
ncbi:Hypothetical predicted protein [Lecanosticta acicola]|uniref:Uncharacterized protein n=1 Tax=Lecanosticta acicola TaxID=111012 RepID=A0AAI8Z032_9PEZI|nr:Hypothetical predicted protein [Lecanosticta acicola]